ncbi:pyrroloquinoline quinone biosynthesis protein D [Sphaerotilus hippei]|uniref:Pyrroloquinoline quinone biosynthesis protein D n=1 Tax=Sphaerotilus hippei TaxID=744406 RepID=A0A318HHI9_9BURK|nr:pyrroloquinoline quinone biosynthesis peptide chaperone PqqD [Sphaerotilus hippei]PXW99533.1 pyrroloquinoline quinone biosynthesis protein D [Sphaerotilus hippei]
MTTPTSAPDTRLPDTTTPRLGRGFRLQWEAAQGNHVLLYPEGMVKLNRSAGEILTRCTGEAALPQLVADLEAAFGAPDLRGDVERFLALARQQRWVDWA